MEHLIAAAQTDAGTAVSPGTMRIIGFVLLACVVIGILRMMGLIGGGD